MSKPDGTLSTVRTLPFGCEQIYAAFADPEKLSRWWGPAGFTNSFEIFEFSVGGRWIFAMHGPDGRHYANESRFLELVPNRKIVIEHLSAPHFILTVGLIAAQDGTRLSWDQAFDDARIAEAVSLIVGPANEENLDRLTELLEERRES